MNNDLLRLLIMTSKYVCYGFMIQLFTFTVLFATEGEAQYESVKDVRITLHIRKATFIEVIKAIESKTSIKFTYEEKDLADRNGITVQVEDQTLEHVLLNIGKTASVNFKQVNDNIHVKPVKKGKRQETIEVSQAIQVSGTVTSQTDGAGLPGVNVLVKGTSTGTVTDVDGKYSLSVPNEDGMLVFSSIGYTTREVAVNGRTVIDVTMAEDVTSLDEIVVVGYGTQKKTDVTGSISTVNSKDLENRPITNSTQAIQGTKGVYVSQAGAQPGRDQATIRIRGQGTLNDNNPLVLVDGVEYPLGDVEPSNIESISVLKDAAAAAIYGSRAANGVILVTTKSGKGVEGFHVDYSNYLGFQKVIGLPDFVKDPVLFMELRDQAQRNAGRSTVDFGEDLINEYRQGEKTDPYIYPQNDWFDIMFDPAFVQNHNLRFTGGSEAYNYSLSLGYLDHNGVLMGTNSNKYSIDLNTNINITDRLSVGAIIDGQFKEFDEAVGGTRYVMEMTYKNAGVGYEPTYLEDGRYADTFIKTPGHYVFRNPIALAKEGINNHKQQHYRLILQGEYKFPLNITYKIKGAFTKEDYLHKIFEPEVYQYDVKTLEKKRLYITGSPIRRVDNTDEFNDILNLQQTLEWSQIVKNDHQISALLGYSLQSFSNNIFNAHNEGYLGNGLTTLNAGSVNPSVSGSDSRSSLMSLFGRLNYNYDEKYLFEGNFRYDGSSKFAKGNKWGVFPSFSLGWRMGQEEFMKNIEWLNAFKFRASWGKLGNERVPSYRYLNLIELGHDYSFSNIIAPGAAVTQYNDPAITWESTTTTNVGLDASFFQAKLDFSFEVFKRRTYNILHAVSIPAQVGDLEGPLQNIGTVDNKGFEISLSYQDNVGPFSYQLSGNLAKVKNNVVDLNGESVYSYGSRDRGGTIIKEGHPINAYYLIHATGIFQSQEEIDAHAFQTDDTRPGYVKFQDVNNDGVINQDDRVILDNKTQFPAYTYSFNVGLSYKNIALSAIFNGVGDVYNYATKQGGVPFWYGTSVTKRQVNEAWTPENRDAELPILTTYEDALNTNYRNSDFMLQNASYLRLKNLQLSYDLPHGFTDRLHIRSAKVFINGENLLTFSPINKYGYDPEKTLESNDYFDYPSVKTYTGGISIGF